MVILLILSILSAIHILTPVSFYIAMRRLARKRPWNLSFDDDYEPRVTIIVATYNEASVIEQKLANLAELDYPNEKLDIIVVDSASTDGTADIAKKRVERVGFPFKISVLEEPRREGKSKALNYALRHVSSEIVATSDADCVWSRDSLKNAVKYLHDPSVAAVCGQEVLTNPNESSATKTENLHRTLFTCIGVGESKIGSTIVIEGALALFKRNLLGEFDSSCDDSGSALNLVQKGYRSILVPDAVFMNSFPSVWSKKIAKKTRRAQHLVEIWWRCMRLDLKHKLKLNPWVSRTNVFLYIFNPFLLVAFVCTLVLVLASYPILLLALPLIVVPKIRNLLLLYFSNYGFLLSAIFLHSIGRRQVVWKK